jgi:tRNA 5-methylaminomethyl-2-thiouridine biosynthesis bifunctional protein
MYETVIWSDNNCPRSPRFDDVYWSHNGSLLQAQTVFLCGCCQLPQRWRKAPQFCILETGFGLGLNFLATWNAWQADAQHCTRLHYVAIEAFLGQTPPGCSTQVAVSGSPVCTCRALSRLTYVH